MLRVAERLYRRELTRRNARFDAGRGIATLDRPVVSIGNLTVGGTGKTPMVRWAVRTLREAGHDPCIAMRGYRAGPGGSDEQAEHQHAFDDLPIVARPDRTEGLIELFGTERGSRTDCVVLDDGFQHRRLARQLDIVLVDATRPLEGQACLPLGWLREPPESLARAHAVVLTHAEAVREDALEHARSHARGYAPDALFAITEHHWSSLSVRAPGVERDAAEPTEWLRGRRIVAACAIGNPGPFLHALREADCEVTSEFVLPDHDPFKPATVRRIREALAHADALVCTGKDFAKLGAHDWPVPVARPVLDLRFRSGETELAGLVTRAAGARVA